MGKVVFGSKGFKEFAVGGRMGNFNPGGVLVGSGGFGNGLVPIIGLPDFDKLVFISDLGILTSGSLVATMIDSVFAFATPF